MVRTRLGGLVLGASPHHHGRLYEAMLGTLGYDRRGPGMMAISALDMALHDLAAQDQGTSVAEMLGGALRGALPAYASAPSSPKPPTPTGIMRRRSMRFSAAASGR
ncbi:hypothetical protein ACFQU7_35945 [Pseudoroseomonas wenyumeiae]